MSPTRFAHPHYPVEPHPDILPEEQPAPQPMDWSEAQPIKRTPFNPTQEQLLAQLMCKSRLRLDRETEDS